MATQKHPVSFLQELMAKQYKPLPQYNIITSHAGFVCTVTVDGITASGTAGSKQAAKLEAATAAVAILNEQLPKQITPRKLPVCSMDTSGDLISLDFESPNTSRNNPFITEQMSFSLNAPTNIFASEQMQHQSLVNNQPIAIGKHPISELQEMFAKQRKPPPDYIVTDISVMNCPSFRCSLTIDGELFVSEAPSKQVARKEVAEKALRHLKQNVSQTLPDGPTIVQATNAPNCNAIGTLNEYLQKKGYQTATYQEQGMSEKNEFVLLCSAAGKSTRGCGANKKQAKQEAALNMIKELNITGQAIVPIPNIPSKIADDKEVIKKYTEFNNGSIQSLIENQEKLTLADSTIKDVPETKTELLGCLADLKIPYKCSTIQNDPLILCLIFQDDVHTTVLGSGNSYEEAYVDVLKRACKLKMST